MLSIRPKILKLKNFWPILSLFRTRISILQSNLSYAILSSSHSSRIKKKHRDSKKLCYCLAIKNSWENSMKLMQSYFLNRQGMRGGRKLISGWDNPKENLEWTVMHLCWTKRKIICFIILLKLHWMPRKGWRNILRPSNKKWWNWVWRKREGCSKNRNRNSWGKSSPSKYWRRV